MPTVNLTDEQVIDLVTQLPPEQKRAALLALAKDADIRREKRLDQAEAQLRRLCAERGLNWDAMGEDERETFIDDLIHEDRKCRM
ncbi:MAG: hypothetical protein SVY10_12845 [Thermodesulfobacteriota bacterium]|nr:hypothetical protein [Thermodesulfobacteriota bacterium]